MDDEEQPLELDVATVLEILAQGELEGLGTLPYSSNYTLLCSAEYQGIQLPAVYKPRRGERPLWDFPQGTLCQREVGAYLLSEALGFSLVPPTVLRDGPYGIGSVQLFIDADPEAHLFTMQQEDGYETALRQLVLFDIVANNADRKSGHCLKGRDDRLWAIDHGICFHNEYKLRTVLWEYIAEPIPEQDLSALQGLHEQLKAASDLSQMFEELLSTSEMRALRRRVERLLRTGLYPAPGPGPNIPWPPV